MKTLPPAPPLPTRVEYHLFRWSQTGKHIAELRTREPLAIPTTIEGDTFADFITNLYHAEQEFKFLTTLTWG